MSCLVLYTCTCSTQSHIMLYIIHVYMYITYHIYTHVHVHVHNKSHAADRERMSGRLTPLATNACIHLHVHGYIYIVYLSLLGPVSCAIFLLA